jgi:molybdopterin biosynthesis enzyme
MAGKTDDAKIVSVVTAKRYVLMDDAATCVLDSHGNQGSSSHTRQDAKFRRVMSMVMADGLLIVPEDVYDVQAGTELPVRLFRMID